MIFGWFSCLILLKCYYLSISDKSDITKPIELAGSYVCELKKMYLLKHIYVVSLLVA